MLNKFGEEDVAARRDWDAELERLQGLAVSCEPEPFTLEELTIACASMKRNRATGPDSVSAELLSQFLFSDVAGCLLQLYNDVLLHKRAFPHAWTQQVAVLIPKVASPQLGKHLRPIVLSSVLQKLLAKMLWNRVSRVVSSYMGGQVGCRPHAQAAEAVFACRALIDKAKEWRRPLVGLKLDVSQAFDRVHQVALLRMLRSAYLTHPHEALTVAHMLCCSSMAFLPWRVKRGMSICIVASFKVAPSVRRFSASASMQCVRGSRRDGSHKGALGHSTLHVFISGCGCTPTTCCFLQSSVAEVKALLADVRAELSAVGLEVNLEKIQMFCCTVDRAPQYHCRAWRSTRHSCSQHRVPSASKCRTLTLLGCCLRRRGVLSSATKVCFATG